MLNSSFLNCSLKEASQKELPHFFIDFYQEMISKDSLNFIFIFL